MEQIKSMCLFEPIEGRYPTKRFCEDIVGKCEKCSYYYKEEKAIDQKGNYYEQDET